MAIEGESIGSDIQRMARAAEDGCGRNTMEVHWVGVPLEVELH